MIRGVATSLGNFCPNVYHMVEKHEAACETLPIVCSFRPKRSCRWVENFSSADIDLGNKFVAKLIDSCSYKQFIITNWTLDYQCFKKYIIFFQHRVTLFVTHYDIVLSLIPSHIIHYSFQYIYLCLLFVVWIWTILVCIQSVHPWAGWDEDLR